MSSGCSITVEYGLRWWVRPYLSALKFFCAATGAEPDEQKVAKLIARHGFWYRVQK